MTISSPNPFSPEEQLAVAAEIVAHLRSRYGERPEDGAAALATALVSLVGAAGARALLGFN